MGSFQFEASPGIVVGPINGFQPSVRAFDHETILDAAFTALQEKKGQVVAILGGHGEVEVQAHCKSDGAVSLQGLAISGFRMVRIPQVWDDPDRREAETHPRNELDRLAQRFRPTLD